MRKVNDTDQPVNPHSLVGLCADRCYGRMPLNNMHKAYTRTNADKILNLRRINHKFSATNTLSYKTLRIGDPKCTFCTKTDEIIEHGYRKANFKMKRFHGLVKMVYNIYDHTLVDLTKAGPSSAFDKWYGHGTS